MPNICVDEYELRPFRPGDTAPALRLARQVHGMELVDPGLERGRRMMESLCQHPNGWPPIDLHSTRTGAVRTCHPHSGGRMAAAGKRRIGFYTLGSPVPWARDMSAVSVEVRARLIEAIGEIQVLAVHPQAQGQGVGTVLVEHAEHTMAAAGARVALAPVIEAPGAARVLQWWQQRGYVFPQRGAHWAIAPWADRDLWLSYEAEPHIHIGLKVLAPQVRLLAAVQASGLGPRGYRPPRVVGLLDLGVPAAVHVLQQALLYRLPVGVFGTGQQCHRLPPLLRVLPGPRAGRQAPQHARAGGLSGGTQHPRLRGDALQGGGALD